MGYAGACPLKDFGETGAHYLHIVDTLETAAFRLRVRRDVGRHSVFEMKKDFALYQKNDYGALMAPRLPLTYTVNALNNRLGQPDLYPYVLTLVVMAKLRFVDGLIHGHGAIEELS